MIFQNTPNTAAGLSREIKTFIKRNSIVVLFILFFTTIQSCSVQPRQTYLEQSKNVLNYTGNPDSATYRASLTFSDKGAWFAYGFLGKSTIKGGFAGPFVMTEQNGVWLSQSLFHLFLQNGEKKSLMDWAASLVYQNSFNSHLEQLFQNKTIKVKQQLVFLSGNTTLQKTEITNLTPHKLVLFPSCRAKIFPADIKLSIEGKKLKITSSKSIAVGYLRFLKNKAALTLTKHGYTASLDKITLLPGKSAAILISQTFIFPQYSWKTEAEKIDHTDFDTLLEKTQEEKERQLTILNKQKKAVFKDTIYSGLIAKLVLTLQNNTRIPAQALEHAGLFPSYHNKWFNGFWAWDSWKHAAALALYQPELAKDQIRALFDYQKPNGFVPDCIFRDTLIEKPNFRDTKPPLATWAVWKIYEQTGDKKFLIEMYPKLKAYHLWWYKFRDHDHDSLCEYGSTDGTLIAAKWESGMDNAVRFDSSKILKNGPDSYSLNQESVDLNAYLYAEDLFLEKIARILHKNNEATQWHRTAVVLRKKIRKQFWDASSGWFYDSNLSGTKLLSNAMGCEGYIPLWAGIATKKQALAIMKNMMDTHTLNTYVPLPTLAANNPKFAPNRGYWRGPVWIDQSYFAIVGLEKYGYTTEADLLADKLLHHAEGVLQKGVSIRENYQPNTGKGLGARNFSWSAAHYLLLLEKNN